MIKAFTGNYELFLVKRGQRDYIFIGEAFFSGDDSFFFYSSSFPLLAMEQRKIKELSA